MGEWGPFEMDSSVAYDAILIATLYWIAPRTTIRSKLDARVEIIKGEEFTTELLSQDLTSIPVGWLLKFHSILSQPRILPLLYCDPGDCMSTCVIHIC